MVFPYGKRLFSPEENSNSGDIPFLPASSSKNLMEGNRKSFNVRYITCDRDVAKKVFGCLITGKNGERHEFFEKLFRQNYTVKEILSV